MEFGDILTRHASCHWILLHTCILADFVARHKVCEQNVATRASKKADLKLKLRESDRSGIDGLGLEDGIPGPRLHTFGGWLEREAFYFDL